MQQSIDAEENVTEIRPLNEYAARLTDYAKHRRTLEYLLSSREENCIDQMHDGSCESWASSAPARSPENDLISAKVLNTLCQEPEKSVDWPDNEQNVARPTFKGNSCQKRATDWKCRKSHSITNSNRCKAWDSGCIDRPGSSREELSKETGKRNFLLYLREQLAVYQETHGTPRDDYSFAALVGVMGQAAGRALLALVYIIANVIPVAEVLLYVARFLLDKIIDIIDTKDRKQILVKHVVLGSQLLTIYICLVFVFGFIITPIITMVIEIITKILTLS